MSVCFLNQWKDKEGRLKAIPHVTTKNTSFLRTAHILKLMGLRNYAFMLALFDPDLANVDVHDLEENTEENHFLRIKVQIEARRNTWYFLRECLRIYEQGGSPVPFRLDRGSCAMTWCWLNGLDYTSMQPRQTGKSSRVDSLIQTPSGWVRNGDLKLGELATMPDGTSAPIIGIYPQGELDMYRVTFEDGRFADCSEDHLWKVYNYGWMKDRQKGDWRVLTLREILDHRQQHPNATYPFYIPLIEPEIKDDVDLPIDPYVLGVLLGDAALQKDCINLATADQFIIDELSRLLPDDIDIVHRARYNYGIVKKNRTKGVGGNLGTSLHISLNNLGLIGTHSDTKFVPSVYMFASASQKLALLQGLMDTDGCVSVCNDGKSATPTFTTTSRELALQVQIIVRSLGGICPISTMSPKYEYQGEKRFGKKAYKLTIRISDPSKIFRLARKIEKLPSSYSGKTETRIRLKSIEPIGRFEAQCIEVDHPDHLYITEGYTVTHNTVCALSLVANVMFNSGYEFVVGGLAKDNDLRQENVKRVKSFGDNLPAWWLVKEKFKDKFNSEEIFYYQYRTHYQTFVAQKEKAAADKQGRGGSMAMIHFDELEYTANIGTSYPTMMSSGSTARENAKKNGKPHSNIITTTAGDPLTQACKEASKILDGAMPFTEQLYDIENNELLHELVANRSPQKMILGVFSHLQLGYTNEWLRERIRRGRLTPDQVQRDFLNKRVSIAEQPIIPKHVLDMINSSQREPNWIEILSDKFAIYWYIPKDVVNSPGFRDKSIVVGCDSSEMIGRDATTLVGIDPRSLDTMFTFHCTEGNINKLGVMIADLMLKYPKIVWIPENKSSGTSLIDIVAMILRKQGHNPFQRIFNWIVDRRHEVEFARFDVRDASLLDTSAKKYFGIKTDKSYRDELYRDILIQGCERAQTRIKDQTLISELNTLTIRNGRVDHGVGGHDDTVIAWLLAMWFILSAKHLDFYGIKPGTVMSLSGFDKADKNQKILEQQEAIRNRVDELEKATRRQSDPSLKKMLEADIKLLKSLIDTSTVPSPSSADELMRDPRKFTDPVRAEQSRQQVDVAQLERNMKAVLGLK